MAHDHSHQGHDHTHNHGGHSHSHASEYADVHGRKLLWVTLINVGIMVLEVIGGLLSNSLALLSDAVHKLGDIFSLVIAWMANRFGTKRRITRKRSAINASKSWPPCSTPCCWSGSAFSW